MLLVFGNNKCIFSALVKLLPRCWVKLGSTPTTATEQGKKQIMTKKMEKRWMTNLLAEAAKCDAQMPWARGARRQAMIARRKAAEALEAKAAA